MVMIVPNVFYIDYFGQKKGILFYSYLIVLSCLAQTNKRLKDKIRDCMPDLFGIVFCLGRRFCLTFARK